MAQQLTFPNVSEKVPLRQPIKFLNHSKMTKKLECNKPRAISESENSVKKYRVRSCKRNKNGKKIEKEIEFGDRRYPDYTTHRNYKRMKNYRARHRCDTKGSKKKTKSRQRKKNKNRSKKTKAKLYFNTPHNWACNYLWPDVPIKKIQQISKKRDSDVRTRNPYRRKSRKSKKNTP